MKTLNDVFDVTDLSDYWRMLRDKTTGTSPAHKKIRNRLIYDIEVIGYHSSMEHLLQAHLYRFDELYLYILP